MVQPRDLDSKMMFVNNLVEFFKALMDNAVSETELVGIHRIVTNVGTMVPRDYVRWEDYLAPSTTISGKEDTSLRDQLLKAAIRNWIVVAAEKGEFTLLKEVPKELYNDVAAQLEERIDKAVKKLTSVLTGGSTDTKEERKKEVHFRLQWAGNCSLSTIGSSNSLGRLIIDPTMKIGSIRDQIAEGIAAASEGIFDCKDSIRSSIEVKAGSHTLPDNKSLQELGIADSNDISISFTLPIPNNNSVSGFLANNEVDWLNWKHGTWVAFFLFLWSAKSLVTCKKRKRQREDTESQELEATQRRRRARWNNIMKELQERERRRLQKEEEQRREAIASWETVLEQLRERHSLKEKELQNVAWSIVHSCPVVSKSFKTTTQVEAIVQAATALGGYVPALLEALAESAAATLERNVRKEKQTILQKCESTGLLVAVQIHTRSCHFRLRISSLGASNERKREIATVYVLKPYSNSPRGQEIVRSISNFDEAVRLYELVSTLRSPELDEYTLATRVLCTGSE